MKKSFLTGILTLLTVLFVAILAWAGTDYGVIYDETDALWSQELEMLGTETLPALTEKYGLDLRVDVLTMVGDGVTLYDTAEWIYENYGYGYGSQRRGLTLTILLQKDETGYTMAGDYDWCIYSDGEDDLVFLETSTHYMLEDILNTQAWAGDAESDRMFLAQVIAKMAIHIVNAEENDLFQAKPELWGSPVFIAETTAYQQSESVSEESMQLDYVTDAAEILSDAEWSKLETQAQKLSMQYQCGVYVVTVDDFTEINANSVFDAAADIYHMYSLGKGSERNGILMLLSMYDRDYALFVYGPWAETAFGEEARKALQEAFLDNFKKNDWAGGLFDYLDKTKECMALAQAGTPMGTTTWEEAFWMALVVSCVLAGGICWFLKKQMLTVFKQTEASEYVAQGGLNLSGNWDRYSHTTRTVRVIESSSDQNNNESGGGGSGSSGKF